MIAIAHSSRRITALALTLPLAFSLSACSVGFTTPAANNTDNSTSVSQQDEQPTTDEAASKDSEASAEKSKDSAADKKADDKKEKAASPSKDNNEPKEVLASWEGDTNKGKVKLDVNSVEVKDGMTVLTMTATNTGSTTNFGWSGDWNGSRMMKDAVTLFDPKNRLSYQVGQSDGGNCLCTQDFQPLEPGQSQSVFAAYQELPEGIDTVNVIIDGLLPFENIPVTRK